MVASKADIIAHESLGYSHVVRKGESYFVNLNSESSRLKFKNYLENETGKEWGIAELGRYVFYRKDMYVLDDDCLKLDNTFRGKVEIPINTVSCKRMFSSKSLGGIDFSDFDTSGITDMSFMFHNCILPVGFSLGNRFDTSSVKDMSLMFSDCVFPEGFSLGDKFDTSSVESMHFMFSCARFNEGFSLGNKFNTFKVRDMRSMFFDCTFSEGFNLGDRFDTSMVEDMGCMFYGTKFNEGFSLGSKFNTSSVEVMNVMFSHARFNEDFRLARDFTICENAEDMFDDAKLPSRVTKQLGSGATDKEIVELLKQA